MTENEGSIEVGNDGGNIRGEDGGGEGIAMAS
jgi:hypothetical protein